MDTLLCDLHVPSPTLYLTRYFYGQEDMHMILCVTSLSPSLHHPNTGFALHASRFSALSLCELMLRIWISKGTNRAWILCVFDPL